jgi:hypothetical protein
MRERRMRHSFTVRAIDARRQLAWAWPDTVVLGMFVCRLMARASCGPATLSKRQAGRKSASGTHPPTIAVYQLRGRLLSDVANCRVGIMLELAW